MADLSQYSTDDLVQMLHGHAASAPPQKTIGQASSVDEAVDAAMNEVKKPPRHTGFAAQIGDTFGGKVQAQPTPEGDAEMDRKVGDFEKGAAVGTPMAIPSGIVGVGHIAELVGRHVLASTGLPVSTTPWIPSGEDFENAVTWKPQSKEEEAGRALSGLISPAPFLKAFGAGARMVSRATRGIREGMSPSNAEGIAGRVLNDIAGPNGATFEDAPLPGMQVSAGQASNNPRLLMAERSMGAANPDINEAQAAAKTTNNQVIRDAINAVGNPEADSSQAMAARIDAAERRAKAVTRATWKAAGIDENTTRIPVDELKDAVGQYVADLPKAYQHSVPDSVQEILGKFGDAEPLKEIQALRSHVGALAAQAARNGNSNDARIIGDLSDRISSFVDDALLNGRVAPTLPDVPLPKGNVIRVGGDEGPRETFYQAVRRYGGLKTRTDGIPTKEGQDVEAVLRDANTRGIINNVIGRGSGAKPSMRPDVMFGALQREGWFGPNADLNDFYDALKEGDAFQHPEIAASSRIAEENIRGLQDARDAAKDYGIPFKPHWSADDIYKAINDTEATSGRAPGDLDTYNAARQATRAMKETFNRPKEIRNVLGTDRYGADKVPISATADQFIRSGNGAPESLQSYLKAVGTDQVGQQAARDAFAKKFLETVQTTIPDQEGDRVVSASKITKFLGDYHHVVGSPLFDDTQRDMIARIGRAAEMSARLARGGPVAGGSDTVAKLAGTKYLDVLVGDGASKIAPIAGGLIGAAVGSPLGFAGAAIGAAGGAGAGKAAAGVLENALFGATRDKVMAVLQAAMNDPDLARTLMARATPKGLSLAPPKVRAKLSTILGVSASAPNRTSMNQEDSASASP